MSGSVPSAGASGLEALGTAAEQPGDVDDAENEDQEQGGDESELD
jgi:hypothetical protein